MLESDVQGNLDDLADVLDGIVLSYATATGIRDQDTLRKDLVAAVLDFLVVYGVAVTDTAGKIVDAKVKDALAETLPLLRKAGANDEARAFAADLKTYPRDLRKRFNNIKSGKYDLTFKDRTDALELSARKTLDNIVELGVRKGKSAQQIADDVRSYINPAPGQSKARPYTIYRGRFGRTDSFQPKDVLPGTMQSNALRYARTQSAEVYRRATEEFYRDKDYADGFDWVLSNTHGQTDICDELAHTKYGPDAKRPYSHDYCVCDWRVRLRPLSVLQDMVAEGRLT